MATPLDQSWFIPFLVAYLLCVVTLVVSIVVQAARFYRQRRTQRRAGDTVVPFRKDLHV